MVVTQSISSKSTMKFSLSKFLVSRLKRLCFFEDFWQSSGIIRNYAKWSDMFIVKFPEVPSKKFSVFEKMLSINVLVVVVILVG